MHMSVTVTCCLNRFIFQFHVLFKFSPIINWVICWCFNLSDVVKIETYVMFKTVSRRVRYPFTYLCELHGVSNSIPTNEYKEQTELPTHGGGGSHSIINDITISAQISLLILQPTPTTPVIPPPHYLSLGARLRLGPIHWGPGLLHVRLMTPSPDIWKLCTVQCYEGSW